MTGLDAAYAAVPALACKGLCSRSCGPIPVSPSERDRLAAAHGAPLRELAWTVKDGGAWLFLEPDRKGRCQLLRNGRCTVHADRPLICRLYGAVDDPTMRCAYGCEPARLLTADEGHALLASIAEPKS